MNDSWEEFFRRNQLVEISKLSPQSNVLEPGVESANSFKESDMDLSPIASLKPVTRSMTRKLSIELKPMHSKGINESTDQDKTSYLGVESENFFGENDFNLSRVSSSEPFFSILAHNTMLIKTTTSTSGQNDFIEYSLQTTTMLSPTKPLQDAKPSVENPYDDSKKLVDFVNKKQGKEITRMLRNK